MTSSARGFLSFSRRESRRLRRASDTASTNAGGRPGTQTLSMCLDVDVTTGSVVSQARGDGPHSTHVCGAPQARLMAFGRQGVTGAERSGAGTEPRGSTAWVRVTSRNRVTMTRLRMGARVAVPQDAPGRGTRPRRERRNRTEPERLGSLLWKGSPAVYGGRGRHV